MKKTIIYIFILSTLIYFSSCNKKTTTQLYYYLKINNTTNHEVLLGLFDKENDTLLVEYFISPNETKFLDTVVYKMSDNDGARYSYVSGRGSDALPMPIWNSNYSEMSYLFDDTKILKKLLSEVEECDTSSFLLQDLCNFGTIELIKKEIKKGIDFEETEIVTYIVTEQQYILADSL